MVLFLQDILICLQFSITHVLMEIELNSNGLNMILFLLHYYYYIYKWPRQYPERNHLVVGTYTVDNVRDHLGGRMKRSFRLLFVTCFQRI